MLLMCADGKVSHVTNIRFEMGKKKGIESIWSEEPWGVGATSQTSDLRWEKRKVLRAYGMRNHGGFGGEEAKGLLMR